MKSQDICEQVTNAIVAELEKGVMPWVKPWAGRSGPVTPRRHSGERYRSKLPISTSRAEGCVDEIANARMAKKQRMRWSPQGAHRISTVRAAVLDGRLKVTVDIPLAA